MITSFSPQAKGIAFAIFSAITFGMYPAASRYVYELGGNASFMIVATTFMRALALFLFCFFSGKAILKNKDDIRASLTGGLFQAISIFGIIGGLVYLPGPIMVIIIFTHTLMLLLYMTFRREIKLDAATLLTTIAALVGLSLVLDIWQSGLKYDLTGLGLALMAAIATASRVYVYGTQTKNRPAAVVGAENFLFAFIFVLPVILLFPPAFPAGAEGLFFTLLGCMSLVLGTFGMFYGISLIGSFKFSLFLKLEPIFTAIFSALIMHEILEVHQYAGIAIVLASLAAYQYLETRGKRL